MGTAIGFTILQTRTQTGGLQFRFGVQFRCSKCYQIKPYEGGVGTGFAYDENDQLICYKCCGEIDREAMIRTGKATLYLTHGGRDSKVTNWPGSLTFKATVSIGRHNWAKKRYNVWFTGPDGEEWYGVTYGDMTQICHCKRLKRKQ